METNEVIDADGFDHIDLTLNENELNELSERLQND